MLPKLLVAGLLLAACGPTAVHAAKSSFYDHSVVGADGKSVALSQYQEGKPVVLVVNVASECGFTPQYAGLQNLYEKYADSGLEIMAFPCNQFGGQEPGSNAEIQRFAKETYGVTFPVFGKIDVNGPKAHELFSFLKNEVKDPTLPYDIRWNFGKFLVVNGRPVKRYAHDVAPADMEKDIVTFLRKAHTGEL